MIPAVFMGIRKILDKDKVWLILDSDGFLFKDSRLGKVKWVDVDFLYRQSSGNEVRFFETC